MAKIYPTEVLARVDFKENYINADCHFVGSFVGTLKGLQEGLQTLLDEKVQGEAWVRFTRDNPQGKGTIVVSLYVPDPEEEISLEEFKWRADQVCWMTDLEVPCRWFGGGFGMDTIASVCPNYLNSFLVVQD